MALDTFVLITIATALAFDFVNGFHDSANAIATVVATKVLKPAQAVVMAGVFNFVGPFVFSLAVANTVGKGIIESDVVTTAIIFAALAGAIVWDLITWWFGLPTSSSHALVGGLIGAGVASAGWGSVFLPEPEEWRAVAGFAWRGAAGGLAAGVLLLGFSRLRLPRALLVPLVLVGMALMGWFSYGHTDASKDLVKYVMVNFVFVFLGAILGGLAWAASQQPMGLRVVPLLAIPGACGTLAVNALLGILELGGVTKVLVFMVVSPILGFFLAFAFYAVLQWVAREAHPERVNAWSRKLQLGSSAFYALTHGTNDAQKTMGVIGVLLLSAGAIGTLPDGGLDIPTWVIIASAAAMGVGTAFGGWRIVKTMASRITHLAPDQGFAAETAGGVVLVAMAESGIPVSTTHAITSSIMGVGATRRAGAVRWAVGRRIIGAWVITIPASAAVAWGTYEAMRAFGVG